MRIPSIPFKILVLAPFRSLNADVWSEGPVRVDKMSLDEAIEYLADDELLEVTPDNFRIRKRILNTDARGKSQKKTKELLEA